MAYLGEKMNQAGPDPMFDATPQAAFDQAERPVTDARHRPADHPPVRMGKVGILLANLGTPDSPDYWPMRRYLSEFLSDRRVVDYHPFFWQPLLQLMILTKRPFSSGANYRSIWNNEANESPLMTITKQQTAAIKAQMQAQFGDRVHVDFCMRYGNPATKVKLQRNDRGRLRPHPVLSAVSALRGRHLGHRQRPAFPRADGGKASARRAHRAALFRSAQLHRRAGTIHRTPPTRPRIIAAAGAGLLSYHGVPERYLKEGDPYHCQCLKTTRLLRERLGWDKTEITTTFQSRFGPEEWLKPYTVEEVARLAQGGMKRLAICAPAFSADCIETLEEINEEIRESL